MSMPDNPTQADAPPRSPLLQAPPTRREVLLFGLLLLAIVFAFAWREPRTVVVVPDTHVGIGVIT
jgi:hypothetical protein